MRQLLCLWGKQIIYDLLSNIEDLFDIRVNFCINMYSQICKWSIYTFYCLCLEYNLTDNFNLTKVQSSHWMRLQADVFLYLIVFKILSLNVGKRMGLFRSLLIHFGSDFYQLESIYEWYWELSCLKSGRYLYIYI